MLVFLGVTHTTIKRRNKRTFGVKGDLLFFCYISQAT